MLDHDYNAEELPTLEDNSYHQESYNDLMGGPIVESDAMPNVHQYLLQDDPLRHASAIQFPSLSTHYVEPHHVSSYIKSNGTFVEGYLRDGDGDTATFDGDGYIA
ncbi:hypothetical protein [Exiguobacterium sp. B2(2022)]|uniref:hypothetical protein n=1 Tax=Exiguobacterium sp. B2(2022) TaxID=2992755 RepID=UPI00237A1E89|nr:hypothetical protein [Exiguobacterium sp. B2(2022)]MDE0564856.1 hypothetical protein [Exiguobacterium sp. B2(2022)]